MKTAAAVLLAFVLAGCGGGGDGGQIATQPAPTGRATPDEVRWVGAALDWTKGLQAESEELMRSLLALDRGRTDDIGPAIGAIRAIDDRCTEPRLERPVTLRLTALHEKLLHLCYHVGGAVGTLETVLDPSPGWTVTSASTRAGIRDFRKHWLRGFQLARQAGRAAAAYAPTNARELPARDGGSGSHVASKLGVAASKLAGEEAVVQCWSKADWPRMLELTRRFLNEPVGRDLAGFVAFGDHRINLPHDLCATLESGRGSLEDRAFALGTLAHEARHVSGTVNETTATCQSVEDLPRAAVLLGQPDGAALAAVFRDAILPSLPPEYRTFEC